MAIYFRCRVVYGPDIILVSEFVYAISHSKHTLLPAVAHDHGADGASSSLFQASPYVVFGLTKFFFCPSFVPILIAGQMLPFM